MVHSAAMSLVLVVDDSAIDRRLAGALLAKASFEVRYAVDGRDALRSIEESRPDLVLTDMTMPELDGLALVAELRQRLPSLPVILMTAHGSEQTAMLALRSGATSFVPKRRLADDLVPTVQGILSISADIGRVSSFDPVEARELRYAVGADMEELGRVVGELESQLVQLRLCEETSTLQVAVALREALVNAVVHGNLEVSSTLLEGEPGAFARLIAERQKTSPYKDRTVTVVARYKRDVAEYVVTDQGPGFDPGGLPDPTDLANLEKPSGRGLMLIRMFMDEVGFNDRGNEIRMLKRRQGA